MSEKILIVGAGGHSRVAQEILRMQFPNWQPLIAAAPGEEGPLLQADPSITKAFIAIGDNYLRKKIVSALLAIRPKLVFPTLIHPKAAISPSSEIGPGSIVMANAAINPMAKVGSHCVINTGAIVEHDCHLEDFCTLATRAALGGNVKVGESTWIGMGANVLHGLTLGNHAALGAGSLLLEQLANHTLAYGVPAKVIRTRAEDERFL